MSRARGCKSVEVIADDVEHDQVLATKSLRPSPCDQVPATKSLRPSRRLGGIEPEPLVRDPTRARRGTQRAAGTGTWPATVVAATRLPRRQRPMSELGIEDDELRRDDDLLTIGKAAGPRAVLEREPVGRVE